MTADELWEKYAETIGFGLGTQVCVDKDKFLAALHAYGEEVRKRAVSVCNDYPKRDPAEDGSGYWAAANCAAAIERMPLP